ncbi:MAG: c-type cytochrome, partial [Alphaproteobacteria bacterium]|nr:c-type cytochrome [Alphaproteobacteria bacterium]
PAARYAALSRGNIPQQAQPLSLLPAQGAQDVNIAACLRCHDGEGKAPTNTLTPRLAGQKRDYLATALKQYSSGARPSGIMQPIAAELKDDEIAALADHYAQLEPTPPYPEEATASQEIMERGRKLFTLGEPEKGVPACQTCHRKETRQSYPLLAGQSVKYITGQLQLWKKYGRSDVPQDAIMEAIAKRLKPEQIAAVSAYIATLPPFDAPQTVSASGQTNGSAPAATTK